MLIFYIVGLIFFIIGVAGLVEALLFKGKARTLKGQILGYETSHSKNGRFYQPVIHYRDGGKDYLFKSGIGTGTMKYALNEKVEVMLLGEWHSTARLKTMTRRWIALVFAAMGALFMGIAIANFKTSDHQFYAIEAALILTIAAVGIGVTLTRKYRQKLESGFDYTLHKNGTIGYQPTPEMLLDTQSVQKYSAPRAALLFGVILGAGMIIGSLYWADHVYSFIEKAEHVSGVIVSQTSHVSDGTTMYSAVIEFTPYQHGKPVRFTSSISSSHPMWEVNDRVHVYYDPDKIDDAMEDLGVFNYIIQFVIGLTGLIIVVVSGIQYRKKSRR